MPLLWMPGMEQKIIFVPSVYRSWSTACSRDASTYTRTSGTLRPPYNYSRKNNIWPIDTSKILSTSITNITYYKNKDTISPNT